MSSLSQYLPEKIFCDQLLKQKIMKEIEEAYNEISFIKNNTTRNKLENLIDDVNNEVFKINSTTTKTIIGRYFNLEDFNSNKDLKDIFKELDKIFRSCIVLILFYQKYLMVLKMLMVFI